MTVTWTKRADLHTETVEGSVVAYDLATGTVHCLADDTSRVFASCTGASAEELAASLTMSKADVLAQLKGLDALKLVESSEPLINRKSVLLGAAAGAAVAAWSIAAPMAAAAASGAIVVPPSSTQPLIITPPAGPTIKPKGGSTVTTPPPTTGAPVTASVATPSTGRS